MVNVITAQSAFRAKFDGLAPTVAAFAPGRVNLIGEHVDYNDGLVLPIAIQLGTTVIAARLEEPVVRAFSAPLNSLTELSCATGFQSAPKSQTIGWSRFLQGVLTELAREKIVIPGAAIHIDSDLPLAAGLSSSASFSAALGMAICSLAGKSMDAADLARLCRRVERDHVGVPCGIMDPFACLLSKENCAMLLDCRDESAAFIRIPDDLELFMIDSGIARELSSSAYADRRRECDEALQQIRRYRVSIPSLRDIRSEDLAGLCELLPDPLDARARHVVTEIARAREAANALTRGDLPRFGKLLDESHASLRDDFAVSLPQIDRLVEIVRAQPGVVGARLTGAGFGGCIIAAAKPGSTKTIEASVRTHYDKRYNVLARIWPAHPSAAASIASHLIFRGA